MVQSAEQAECVRGRRERKHCGGRPSERVGKREGEEIPDPAESASNVGATAEKSDTFGGERAGKEQREQQQHDARELAPQGRAGRGLTVRGRVRVE